MSIITFQCYDVKNPVCEPLPLLLNRVSLGCLDFQRTSPLGDNLLTPLRGFLPLGAFRALSHLGTFCP